MFANFLSWRALPDVIVKLEKSGQLKISRHDKRWQIKLLSHNDIIIKLFLVLLKYRKPPTS